MNERKYIVVNARSSSAVATSVALCICMVLTVYLSFFGKTVNTTSGNIGTSAKTGAEIIIDAGHGGLDGGAVAADGTLEKDINLAVALCLERLCRENGITAVMTRTDDALDYGSETTVAGKKRFDILHRMNIMKSNPGALFISIHQNYFEQTQYSGAQVFYAGNTQGSEALADSIQRSITESLQPDNQRQIKKSDAGIYLLYHACNPAVMVECGFLSNAAEAQKLKQENYQQEMAKAIYNGIIAYRCVEKTENTERINHGE